MCGRLNVSDHEGVRELMADLGMPLYPNELDEKYNLAPAATLMIATADDFTPAEWGIVPPWTHKVEKFSRPLINARCETVWGKPSFRHLIKTKRAIIPVNGFYEWKRDKSGKQAYYFTSGNAQALALGGLYQVSKDGVPQCCIITTAANDVMSPVHHRMPVIIPKTKFKSWLNDESNEKITKMMAPSPKSWIKCYPVSNYVNSTAHQGEVCVKKIKLK